MTNEHSPGAIDIHHHYVPLELIEEVRRHGDALGAAVSEVRGSYAFSFAGSKPHRLQPPIFDVAGHLQVMDQGHIQIAALEANTNSLGYRLDGARGEAWSKLYNSCVADRVRQRPDRFAGMATVPLQEPARAAKVLEQAINELNFCGAFIGIGSAWRRFARFDVRSRKKRRSYPAMRAGSSSLNPKCSHAAHRSI